MDTLAPRKLEAARRPRLELPIAFALCAAVTALFVLAGYVAVHNLHAARDARERLADLQRSIAAKERSREQLLQAVPNSRTVSDYGAPYNVRVVCTVAGSVNGPHATRRPLDLHGTPRPGDVYVKTCRGLPRPAKTDAGPSAPGRPSS